MANQHCESFVAFLQKRSEDRRFMADLKYAASAATEHRAYEHVVPWCKDMDHPGGRSRRIILTVSAGFALCGSSFPNSKNLGSVLRKIAGDLPTFDARFRRILACTDVREACGHIFPVLKTAATKHIPVDFAQLYMDMTYWGENVRIRWATSYWRSQSEEGAA